jgi:hypothetical protein
MVSQLAELSAQQYHDEDSGSTGYDADVDYYANIAEELEYIDDAPDNPALGCMVAFGLMTVFYALIAGACFLVTRLR